MIRSLIATVFLAAAGPALAAPPCGVTDLIADLPADERQALRAAVADIAYSDGVMFRATKDDSTVTVVGTLHIPDPRLSPMVEKLRPVVREADLLVLELTQEDENELQKAAVETPSLFFLTEGPTLIDLLGDRDWALAKDQLEARGIPPFFAAKFQPWYLSTMLSVPPCAATVMQSGQKGLDRQLEAIAVEAGVERSALDEPDVLFDIFGQEPLDDQIEVLRYGLRSDLNGDAMFSTLLAAYFDGRIVESFEYTRLQAEAMDGGRWGDVMDDFETAVLIDRNRAWEPKIVEMVAGRDAVVAVGAGHLSGETGVLKALERAGYTITPF